MRIKLGLCLALLPLMGADPVAENQFAISIAANCPAGQYLVFRSGDLKCESITSSVSLTNCTGQLLTYTTGGAGGELNRFSCVAQGQSTLTQTNVDTVADLLSKLTVIGSDITKIQMNPPAALSTYIGSTDTPTVGQITFTAAAGQPPVDNGIPAATAQCNQKYMGSHMCSVYEMYASLATAKLKSGTAVPRAWTYMAAWNFPMGTPPLNSDTNNAGGPQEGTAENCGSYTYKTANRKWTGTAVEYNKLQTGDWGLRFHSGAAAGTAGTTAYEPGAPCNQPLPIACCK